MSTQFLLAMFTELHYDSLFIKRQEKDRSSFMLVLRLMLTDNFP